MGLDGPPEKTKGHAMADVSLKWGWRYCMAAVRIASPAEVPGIVRSIPLVRYSFV